MNIACVSHYSPLINNNSNSWMLDFYSNINALNEISTVYFFHIKFKSQKGITVTQTKTDKKIIDISINIPIFYKLLRKFYWSDTKFITIVNKKLNDFLNENQIKIEIIHVNTLYYSFVIDKFKEYYPHSKYFLHLHENTDLLDEVIKKSKYKAVNYIGRYDYLIRQTPVNINTIKKYNKNIIFLPNAFNHNLFKKVNLKTETNTKQLSIISIGYLKETKNYKLAIDTIKRLIDTGYSVKYHIVGSGPEDKNLKKYVKKIGLNNIVIFHGYQSKEKVQRYLRSSHILINTSYFESFGNAIIEAITSEIPVVTCAKGGPEYLFKWANERYFIGHFTAPDKNQLYKAIIDIYTNKNTSKLMEESSAIVKQKFSSEKFINDLIQISKFDSFEIKEWWN